MKKLNLVIRHLKQSVLFSNLNADDLNVIAHKVKIRQFFAEEVIVMQDTPGDSLFIITNGIVAVKKFLPNEQEQIFAYLMPGNTFGEVGILENEDRSATVQAQTDVDVLVIKRDDFMNILYRFPSVTIELAKMLGRYLLESNRRLSRGNKNNKVILLFDIFDCKGASTIGMTLARTHAENTGKKVVYTEYPSPQRIVSDLDLDKKTKTFQHPTGFDIMIAQEKIRAKNASSTTESILLYEKMLNDYDDIVIVINENVASNGKIDDNINMMLKSVDQILFLLPPDHQIWKKMLGVQKSLRAKINANEVNIFTIVNDALPGDSKKRLFDNPDFRIPHLESFPAPKDTLKEDALIPSELLQMAEDVVDRLERSNQIGIFIPTTVDVDQETDTTPFVKRTMEFLAERFGGATSKEAQGVWNSNASGLVGETVIIVTTYVTLSAMNQHLDEVINFIKELKEDLRQEAMALEINQKLTLI